MTEVYCTIEGCELHYRGPSSQIQGALLYLIKTCAVYPSEHDPLYQCCFNVGPPSLTLAQHWNSIDWMHRVCWEIVFWALLYLIKTCGVYPSQHDALYQCCFNVGPPSSTLAQHWNSIDLMCLLRNCIFGFTVPNKAMLCIQCIRVQGLLYIIGVWFIQGGNTMCMSLSNHSREGGGEDAIIKRPGHRALKHLAK